MRVCLSGARRTPRSGKQRAALSALFSECSAVCRKTMCRERRSDDMPPRRPDAASGNDLRARYSGTTFGNKARNAKFGRAFGQGCRAATMIFLFYGLPAQTVCPSGDLAAEASLRGTPFGRDVPVWSDGLETARSTRSRKVSGMNLLQRRLFAEFSKVFILSLAILLLFILMGQAMRLRDMLLGLELGLVDTLRLFLYLTPSLLQYVLPVACMLAVFLTFLRMSSDRELIALKAGGCESVSDAARAAAVQRLMHAAFPVDHHVLGRLGSRSFSDGSAGYRKQPGKGRVASGCVQSGYSE